MRLKVGEKRLSVTDVRDDLATDDAAEELDKGGGGEILVEASLDWTKTCYLKKASAESLLSRKVT